MSPPARIEIIPFAAEHLMALIRLAERAWKDRPRSDAYYRWRYLHSPAQRILLAMRGEECLAMMAAFERDYLFDGAARTCLETLDWYCLPEYRFSGLGVRVLQGFMKSAEPIIAVGGTTDTLAVLPRLGWRPAISLTTHLLPLDGSVVDEALQRRLRIPAPAIRLGFRVLGRRWFVPRRRGTFPGGEVRAAESVGEEILPLYRGDTGYRLLPLPHLSHLRWTTSEYPPSGPFEVLHFMVGGVLRGWSMLRVHGPAGRRWVSLIDLFAPKPDEALYAWMVAESALRATAHAPVGIDTMSACPILRRALRRNRFLELGPSPVHVWPAALPAFEPAHMLRNVSDGSLFPYAAEGRS